MRRFLPLLLSTLAATAIATAQTAPTVFVVTDRPVAANEVKVGISSANNASVLPLRSASLWNGNVADPSLGMLLILLVLLHCSIAAHISLCRFSTVCFRC